MLERLSNLPKEIIGFRATGTVIASDVEKSLADLAGSEGTIDAKGLAVVVDRDFDGYFAELARGMAHASSAYKSLEKLAVVVDADRMGEARPSSFDGTAANVRLFATPDRTAAFAWVAGSS